MSEQPSENEFLVDGVARICRDRGSAACLKKYWSDGTRHYAFPVFGALGIKIPDGADARMVALFALHPKHSPESSGFGRALKKLDGGTGGMDSRVRRLLAADDLDDATLQIRRLMPMLAREGVSVNYNSLLWDLRKWGKDPDEVKTRWGRDYWMGGGKDGEKGGDT